MIAGRRNKRVVVCTGGKCQISQRTLREALRRPDHCLVTCMLRDVGVAVEGALQPPHSVPNFWPGSRRCWCDRVCGGPLLCRNLPEHRGKRGFPAALQRIGKGCVRTSVLGFPGARERLELV